MKLKSLLVAVVCCWVLSGILWGQDKRPMTVDDALNMVQIGQAVISPDGEWVLYARSELDWEENKRKTTYHRVAFEGGESYQFLGEDGGSAFAFSPKGTYLSFLRSTGKGDDASRQIFMMRTAGGEAIKLTDHKGGIDSYKWTRDESRIFFVADEIPGDDEKKRRKKGEDAIFVDEDANGQAEDKWSNLWVFEVAEKKETRVTDEKFLVGSWDVSPDGERLIFTARFENRRNQGNLSEIYHLNVQSKLRTRLTENKAPESRLVWDPLGRTFAYMAADDREWELRNDKIWVMNPDSKEYRMVSGGFEGNIRNYYWSPDGGSLLFSGNHGTDTNLFRLDLAGGAVTPLTEEKGTLGVLDFSADRSRYIYSFSDFNTPADLWAGQSEGRHPVRLTHANPEIEQELLLAQGRTIRWNSQDGLEIEGLFLLPKGYRQGARLPLLLHIHGGPAGVFTNRFNTAYHIYAGLGYAILSPNVRGSSGYSDDLLRGNVRDIGGGDYQDLMTGVDAVIDQGYVDETRMGVKGWSYGGILGGWTITQTQRFKAASLGAMVSDWTSEYGPGFNFDVRLWYIGGTPWENPDDFRAKSSLTHIANVQTPTILFHGMRDTVDTEPQSMMFFAALKDRGIPVRYLRFPREGHGFREPRHQRIRDVEEIKWMQQHVLGVDWKPWERPEKKGEKKDKDVAATETQPRR